MRKKIINKWCNLFGHAWRYKDYSNWIKENGEAYDFKASRNCGRCKQHEYLYGEWKVEDKIISYDIERNSQATKLNPYLHVDELMSKAI